MKTGKRANGSMGACEDTRVFAETQYDRRRKARAEQKRRRRRQRRIRRAAAALAAFLAVVGIYSAARLNAGEGSGLFSVFRSDEQQIAAFAKKNGYSLSDYPEELIRLYGRNREARDFVLEYPKKKEEQPEIDLSGEIGGGKVPLLMQWDQRWGYHQYAGNVMGLTGCGPTCLSMVAIYLTGDASMNPAWMADFATSHGYASEGNGSAWALFSEGGQTLGFDVTEIPLSEQRIIDNLEAGNPIVAVMGPGDFTTSGHFIVFTGCEDGKLWVNDPNSHANSGKLWEYSRISSQIKDLWVFRS